VTVLSCDNLAGNGRSSRRPSSRLPPGATLKRRRAHALIGRTPHFPLTMVDCIVPAATQAAGSDCARAGAD